MRNIKKITSRSQFIEYCMRQLGAPVIQINVALEQAEDRVDDALSMFYDYHVDGSERAYVVHTITQDDLDNKYILLDENVLVVTGIMKSDVGTGGYNLTNNIQMKAYFSDMISNATSGGVGNFVMTKSYLNTFNNIMGGTFEIIEHNYYKRELSIFFDWSKLEVGHTVGYECWIANDIDEVYNDYWLKQYATALIKKQWGMNLIKVDGMTLPGGGVIKGSEILSQANTEISELEERMRDEFAYPVMPRMG